MLLQKQLPKPNLDDKTFARLVEEAVKLIPRHCPGWTDHNLSDPGITLIDLFGWLTEISLYRLNLITDRHRKKYLKLLGFMPAPNVPARVDLTIDSGGVTVELTEGAQVTAVISGRNIHFELSEGISVVPVKLVKVIVDELTGGVYDRTIMNEQADLFYAPFGLDVKKDCAFYLALDSPSDTLSFMCYLYENDLMSPGCHGNELDYVFRNSRLRWEISTSGGNWKAISPDNDATQGFKKSGRLVFKDISGWTSGKIYVSDETCYWLRCVVEESFMEYPPRIEAIRLNTVTAIQWHTVRNGEKWTGNGMPEQTYKLACFPVLDQTVELLIDGIKWHETDDFDGSSPEHNHFILNGRDGEIRFGDGITGKIPPAGSSVEVIHYKTCLGASGNVTAGCSWNTSVMNGLKIKNLKPATGGREAESIDDAVYRFIKDMKIPYTAVTSADFEYIAVNTPGLRVAKAKAVPDYHPESGYKRGLVTVVVIPFTPLEFFERPPYPSEGFRQAICKHLDKHRLICTEIYVSKPLYVKVSVSLTIVLSEGFQEEAVIYSVTEGLNRFLHPVKGGAEKDGWPIGRNVYRSEIYELVENIDCVKCAGKLFLSGDMGAATDGEGNLMLPSEIATVYSGRHSITVLGEVESCSRRKENAKDYL